MITTSLDNLRQNPEDCSAWLPLATTTGVAALLWYIGTTSTDNPIEIVLFCRWSRMIPMASYWISIMLFKDIA